MVSVDILGWPHAVTFKPWASHASAKWSHETFETSNQVPGPHSEYHTIWLNHTVRNKSPDGTPVKASSCYFNDNGTRCTYLTFPIRLYHEACSFIDLARDCRVGLSGWPTAEILLSNNMVIIYAQLNNIILGGLLMHLQGPRLLSPVSSWKVTGQESAWHQQSLLILYIKAADVSLNF